MTLQIYKGYLIMTIQSWRDIAVTKHGNDWMRDQLETNYRYLLRTGQSWVATAEQSIVCTYFSGATLEQVKEKIDTEA